MNRPGFVGDLGVCCRRTRSDREAPDAEFQTRSALAVAPALWLAFLSSSRNSPEIWLVVAVMSGAGYPAASQSRARWCHRRGLVATAPKRTGRRPGRGALTFAGHQTPPGGPTGRRFGP